MTTRWFHTTTWKVSRNNEMVSRYNWKVYLFLLLLLLLFLLVWQQCASVKCITCCLMFLFSLTGKCKTRTSWALVALHLQPREDGPQVRGQLVEVPGVRSSLTASHTANRKSRTREAGNKRRGMQIIHIFEYRTHTTTAVAARTLHFFFLSIHFALLNLLPHHKMSP